MNSTRELLAAGVIATIMTAGASVALAQNATTAPAVTTNAESTTNVGVGAVDAGKLINENVYDAKGDKVGDIESVIVDPNGKVTQVVLDVGGWLSSDKRISVPWKDLKADQDGKITTSMTKEQAQSAADYAYKQDTLRGKVQTANGDLYNNQTTANNATSGAGAPTTGQAASNDNASQNASATTFGTPVKNADGSLNASQVIGMKVVNNSDESIGKVGELVLGSKGEVTGVVVDVGGFLGIGTHPVMLDWKQLKVADKDGSTEAVVDMSKDQLKQMPAYKAK